MDARRRPALAPLEPDDMCAKGRRAVLIGERHPMARLTERDVSEIRRRYAGGGVTIRELAAEYGRHATAISFIVTRRTWRHVP